MLSFAILNATTPQDRPPLLIAHGLFGSGRNWGVIARRLADTRDVITVDMRNHGDSPRAATQSYPEMADDLAQVIMAHGGTADVLGHSMGGKAAMVLALTQGALVRRLVVADIAPVAYTHDQSQNIAAMAGLDLTDLANRADADQRLSKTITDPALWDIVRAWDALPESVRNAVGSIVAAVYAPGVTPAAQSPHSTHKEPGEKIARQRAS